MQTAYKVYTWMSAERLREKMKRKAVLSPNQTGVRRRINNIYVLIYLINRQTEKKRK